MFSCCLVSAELELAMKYCSIYEPLHTSHYGYCAKLGASKTCAVHQGCCYVCHVHALGNSTQFNCNQKPWTLDWDVIECALIDSYYLGVPCSRHGQSRPIKQFGEPPLAEGHTCLHQTIASCCGSNLLLLLLHLKHFLKAKKKPEHSRNVYAKSRSSQLTHIIC